MTKKNKQEVKFTGYISGKIKDTDNKKALEFATVSLTHKKTNKLIEGTITDNKGRFLFEEINVGEYIIGISFIGFENKQIEVKTSKSKPDFTPIFNSFFSFLSQFEKPDPESRLNSKYLIVGFSSTEIFITPSLLIMLISEKRSVLKSDWILALLTESKYSTPILNGTYLINVFSVVLLRPINLIAFIVFE